MTAASNRLNGVQMLRGVAALLVVLVHGAKEVLRIPVFADSSVLWYMDLHFQFGVDIFFVISGFIMFYISRAHLAEPCYPAQFFRHRLARIVPLYWLVTSLIICISLTNPQLKHDNTLSVPYVLASYFFVPFFRPTDGALEPVFGLGWTLNYEMYFYAVFALMVAAFRSRAVPVLCVFFLGSYFFGVFFVSSAAPVVAWSRSVMLEFLFGILIAQMYCSGFRLPGGIWPILAAGGFLLWIAAGAQSDQEFRGLTWGIPAALIVGAVVLGARGETEKFGIAGAGALMIGNASYSLYLTHPFVMRVCSVGFAHLPVVGWAYAIAYIGVFVALSVYISLLSYRFYEMPSNRLSLRFLRLKAA
jgi:exopolysaccharide production protein ExoZ